MIRAWEICTTRVILDTSDTLNSQGPSIIKDFLTCA